MRYNLDRHRHTRLERIIVLSLYIGLAIVTAALLFECGRG